MNWYKKAQKVDNRTRAQKWHSFFRGLGIGAVLGALILSANFAFAGPEDIKQEWDGVGHDEQKMTKRVEQKKQEASQCLLRHILSSQVNRLFKDKMSPGSKILWTVISSSSRSMKDGEANDMMTAKASSQ